MVHATPRSTQHTAVVVVQDWVKAIDLVAWPAGQQGSPSLLLASAGQDKYVRLWTITALGVGDDGADPLTRCRQQHVC